MIKKIIKKLIYKQYANSETYISWLKKTGVRIGERTTIFDPRSVCIDITRPFLIDIGDDVQITSGVIILTHGYDWSVLKGKYGEVLGSSGKVTIGNNVFIGMNSTILKGVKIGNNVIVGANTLVNKDIPNNCVVGGNPVRVLMTIEEYHQKRKDAQITEATQLVKEYREVYGKEPGKEELSEFFWLFTNESIELPECWKKKMRLLGNEVRSNQVLNIHEKLYENIDDFLRSIK